MRSLETVNGKVRFLHPKLAALFKVAYACLFTSFFVATSYLLHQLDLRNQYFDKPSFAFPLHHLLIAILTLFLAWLFFAVGHGFTKLLKQDLAITHKFTLEAVILRCFIGLSLMQLFAIALGFLKLLYSNLAIAITSLLLLLSWPFFSNCISQGYRLVLTEIRNRQSTLNQILMLVLIFISATLFITKVILPTTDWDTITHYNQYFMEVVRNHHLYPNNVWYHYFYSKGAGAFIWSILLSEQDGHKLITYITLLYACMAIWSLLKICHSRTISLICLIAYLGIFVSSNWYFFDKQHVMMSSMLLALFWSEMHTFEATSPERNLLNIFNVILIGTLILFVPTTAGILLPGYGLLGLYYFVKNNRCKAFRYSIYSLWVFTITLLVLTFNFFTAGMFEINPAGPFFSLANLKLMSEWTSPYIVLSFLEGFPKDLTSFSFRFSNLFKNIINLLHINEFAWLHISATFFIILFLIYLTKPTALSRQQYKCHLRQIISIIYIICLSVLMSFTMSQPISASRFFIFTTPLILLTLSSCIAIIIKYVVYPSKQQIALGVVAGFVIFYAFKDLHNHQPYWRKIVLPYMIGKKTYKDVYQTNNLFSNDTLIARRLVGLDKRIITSNPMEPSCTIPGLPMEVELNYSYRDWHTMIFATSAQAKAAYENEGLKYFYFDFQYPLNGHYIYSPLFARESILNYFQVLWHSKYSYLLTWQEKNHKDLTQELQFVQLLEKNKNVLAEKQYLQLRTHWLNRRLSFHPQLANGS